MRSIISIRIAISSQLVNWQHCDFAEVMTTSGRDVDEALWDELQAHFDDGEIVELASVVGLFNFFNRYADALRILPAETKTGD